MLSHKTRHIIIIIIIYSHSQGIKSTADLKEFGFIDMYSQHQQPYATMSAKCEHDCNLTSPEYA